MPLDVLAMHVDHQHARVGDFVFVECAVVARFAVAEHHREGHAFEYGRGRTRRLAFEREILAEALHGRSHAGALSVSEIRLRTKTLTQFISCR